MEMALDQQQLARNRRQDLPVSVTEGKFTPEELAQIMREANSRQSSPSVASIEEALETARELGIDEKHVLAAARDLQERKIRTEVLRRRTRASFMKLVRYLGSMAFVLTVVGFVAGLPTAKLVAFGMGIGAIVMTAQWLKSLFNERFPPER